MLRAGYCGKGVIGYSSRGGEAYPKWWCTGNFLYLLHLATTYGNIVPFNQLIRDIRRFAAVSDAPPNISSNPPMLVPAEGPLLQLNSGCIREAYRDSALSARIQIRCDPLVSLVWLNETNQMNKTNYINGMNQINTADHERGGYYDRSVTLSAIPGAWDHFGGMRRCCRCLWCPCAQGNSGYAYAPSVRNRNKVCDVSCLWTLYRFLGN